MISFAMKPGQRYFLGPCAQFIGLTWLFSLSERVLALILWISLLAGSFLSSATAAERCKEWTAKMVSVQGAVEVRSGEETQWEPVLLSDILCPGDVIRVGERSRAALVLPNESILRLDENTAATFPGLEKGRTSLLDLFLGAIHFISRAPQSLKVTTPFINAAVEGTEFFVKVEPDQATIFVFEGRVSATHPLGRLTLVGGQAAVAQPGQPPILRIPIRPRDAIQWALYYPPLRDYRPADFPGEAAWQAMVRRSIAFYRQGDLIKAFASLAEAPEGIQDPRFFIYRAVLLLTVGRVEGARADIERASNLDPNNGPAFGLRSIIAVVQNDKDGALSLARKAVEADPKSATARVALSYAQQAAFDLEGALASLKDAVKLDPQDSLAWARLAELWLSFGNLDKALKAAQKAVALNPRLARTQTVLGYAYLAQVKTRDAKKAFEEAIKLDQADPLPRLGSGLATIREGELKGGRREMEIAASLDPNTSLVRSYLGKGYYEEKRDKPARDQWAIAKELDPLDPTPWFYDAIRKQTVNRPVEALQDLERSIALNHNRAIYRSRLLLEEDLAARSASLGRIYSDLGFQQRALVEGWRSIHRDPGDYSAHRFLADSYAALPRHEIARVSELLQSQLLQPLNITPIQPQLAETNLFILSGAGPSQPSFNEFNPLFHRDRFALQVDGVAGENDTLGDDLIQSGVQGRFSYSVGQFHYETAGFRENNDQDQDIYNAFVQMRLSYQTSVQAEFRSRDFERGDLNLRFDPNNFSPTLRQEDQPDSVRLGFHHAFTPNSDILASAIYQSADFGTRVSIPMDGGFAALTDTLEDDGYTAEVQHLLRFEKFSLIGGVGRFHADRKRVVHFIPFFSNQTEESDIHHTNLYAYSQINYPASVTWTLGGSGDFFKGDIVERDQFNPKFGLTWTPFPTTTLRAAVFRALKRMLISNQTVEPTQVAGFNQFFDEDNGTGSWRYGIALDQKFPAHVYGGVEFSKRDLDVATVLVIRTVSQILETEREERLGRAYLYWTPQPWLALSAEYQYERFERDPRSPGVEAITRLRTHRLPLGINFFHPLGFIARLKATYIDQEGDFFLMGPTPSIVPGADQFWVVDASIGYRLPDRWGLLTLEARNLFNEPFKFQDTDPANPQVQPERLILARFTLSF